MRSIGGEIAAKRSPVEAVIVDLIESGAATGLCEASRPGKVVTTFALGTS